MAKGTKGFGKATRNAASAVPRSAGGGPSAAALASPAGPQTTNASAVDAVVPPPRPELEDGDGFLLERAGSEGLLMDDSEYNDEVDNEFVRGRMENVVRVATGDDVRITFGQGFHTDMNGTVQLDPYDPDRDAPAEDRILMMQGGLEHEICHELYYDKAAFGELQRQAAADPSRSPVAYINNILVDGHDEWRHKLARAEAYEVIAAHDALFVEHNGSGRWSFDAENQDTWTQVTGAMLYR
ncbi:MAG: hypothetical protein M3Q49_19195, partial [Actinomycetota bacterium]|nr:hypothetical protein [Actinomycetota bacterium]